ncbi:MAG: alpha-1,2-fucosyltransferase [Chlorobaculum sp.]|nr:alpha-1,2-fucosyltransferase [Chlorobaculum sp.]
MIIVKVTGGLGNQLFQYAAGRHLAFINNSEVVLDLSWYSKIPSADTVRNYELDKYQIKARTTSFTENIFCQIHNNRTIKKLPLLNKYIYKYKEKSFFFDPNVLSLRDNVYLNGYWQSQLYFEGIAEIIKNEFTPIATPSEEDAKLISIIKKTSCIGVHVRRGDYVSKINTANTHGTCSPEYYQNAFSIICSHINNPHFIVFSDDIKWSKNNIDFPGTVSFASHNGAENAFQDLRLMSLCDHQIIANSSFSWWAAWLNQKEDKIIISPKQWFADNTINTSTLIPKEWIKIS